MTADASWLNLEGENFIGRIGAPTWTMFINYESGHRSNLKLDSSSELYLSPDPRSDVSNPCNNWEIEGHTAGTDAGLRLHDQLLLSRTIRTIVCVHPARDCLTIL